MRLTTRCARMCADTRGYPRAGDQWVHVFGATEWVCRNCAERLGRAAGILTPAQVKRDTARREAGLQLVLPGAGDPHLPKHRGGHS